MRCLSVLFCLSLCFNIAACNPSDENGGTEIPGDGGNSGNGGNGNAGNGSGENNGESMKINITVGSAVFSATLADNETVKAFKALLPMTVDMNDLNSNEKYYHMSTHLPVSAQRYDTINNGDLMLYGSNSLVLFYKTFASGYSYTRLGRVDDPDSLQTVLGSGSVKVTFE